MVAAPLGHARAHAMSRWAAIVMLLAAGTTSCSDADTEPPAPAPAPDFTTRLESLTGVAEVDLSPPTDDLPATDIYVVMDESASATHYAGVMRVIDEQFAYGGSEEDYLGVVASARRRGAGSFALVSWEAEAAEPSVDRQADWLFAAHEALPTAHVWAQEGDLGVVTFDEKVGAAGRTLRAMPALSDVDFVVRDFIGLRKEHRVLSAYGGIDQPTLRLWDGLVTALGPVDNLGCVLKVTLDATGPDPEVAIKVLCPVAGSSALAEHREDLVPAVGEMLAATFADGVSGRTFALSRKTVRRSRDLLKLPGRPGHHHDRPDWHRWAVDYLSGVASS